LQGQFINKDDKPSHLLALVHIEKKTIKTPPEKRKSKITSKIR
jgi:hypothetical protein